LEEARAQADAFGRSVKSSFSSVGAGLVGALGVGVLVGQWRAMSEQFDRVAKLAARFGESAESLQRVSQAASLAGSDIELVARAMTLANQAAQKGSEAFSALGISAQEFAGMSLEDRLLELSRALRNAFAAANVVSEETIKQAERVNDQLTRLKNETIASLGPAFIAVGGIVVQTIETMIKAWQLFVGSVTLGVVSIGEALKGNFSQAADLLKQIAQDAKDFASQTAEGFSKAVNPGDAEKPKPVFGLDAESVAMTQAEVKKLADLRQRIDEAQRKANFENYSNEQKLLALMQERDTLRAAAIRDDEVGLSARLRLVETYQEEKKIRADIAKEDERIAALRKSLAEKQSKIDFDRKDDKGKLADVRQRIQAADKDLAKASSEEEKIRLQMRLLDLKKEEADLADEIAAKEKRRIDDAVRQATYEVDASLRKSQEAALGIGAVSSLARLGGGGGVEIAGASSDPAVAMVREQERSRAILQRIEQILKEQKEEAI
jgi:hypothetical protein